MGELVARGKLTEEQAEQHPQRSVITRALGPEASVQVDIDIFPAKAGDLFLLCSDGLTSMVHEPKLRPLFEEADSLEQLGKRLIDAANAAGGRDNITVILFRLEEVEGRGGAAGAAAAAAPDEGETSEYDTFEGEAVRSPRQGVTRADADALPAAEVADAVEEDYRRDGTVALSAIRPPGESESVATPEEPPPQDDAARSATATPPPRRTAPLPGRREAPQAPQAAGPRRPDRRPRPPRHGPRRRLDRHARRLLRRDRPA